MLLKAGDINELVSGAAKANKFFNSCTALLFGNISKSVHLRPIQVQFPLLKIKTIEL